MLLNEVASKFKKKKTFSVLRAQGIACFFNI